MSKKLLVALLLGWCTGLAGTATAMNQLPQAGRSRSQPIINWRSAPALPAVTPIVVSRGPNTVRAVALTFDACQAGKPAGYDRKIIKILRETHTPATLFLGGKWMESHPDVTRELARNQLFELGNHSYSHPHLTRLSESEIRREIQRPQDIMFTLTGKQGVLFRAPYGEYDNRVLRIAGKAGLTVIRWEVVTGDPDKGVTAKRMNNTVAEKARNGSIIIMHMNGRGWHTAEALPTIIAKLKAEGYALVTVSDLLSRTQTEPSRKLPSRRLLNRSGKPKL